jgi:hypothetical protein
MNNKSMYNKKMSSQETTTDNNNLPLEVFHFQKMLFVFNALMSGWTVKMVENNTFEFKKDRKNQEVNLDNYLRTFVLQNLSVDNIPSISNENSSNQKKASSNKRTVSK